MGTSNPSALKSSPIAIGLSACRGAFAAVGILTGLINMLMLTGSFFMLQVYDRVLPSRSVPTLIALGALAAALYAFQGFLDMFRGRILARIASFLDEKLSARIYDAVAMLPLNCERSRADVRTKGGGAPKGPRSHQAAFASGQAGS